jgi:NADPH:quinone reductase-like Zn-dependent oxidoreductase
VTLFSIQFAGDVTAVGKDVESVKIGDNVLGLTRFGAYVSHLNVSPKYLSSCPSDWSYAETAAYLVQVYLLIHCEMHLACRTCWGF